MWPYHPRLLMHDVIKLACPMLFHLKLMWDDEADSEVGQNIKVGVLGDHLSHCALIRF